MKVKHLTGQTDLLALHAQNPQRYPFLLQSAVQTTCAAETARYDILFAFPQDTLSLASDGSLSGAIQNKNTTDFLSQFDAWFSQTQHNDEPIGGIPFQGGWFVFLGYELAQQIETRLDLPRADTPQPVAIATRVPAAIIYDHDSDKTILVAETGAEHLLPHLDEDFAHIGSHINIGTQGRLSAVSVELQEDPSDRYLDSVARVKNYIVEGDVFQVNLSRAWQGRTPHNLKSVQLYQRLCQSNPAPFAGLACYEDFAVICSSPERLIRVKDRIAQTRPIAGTRPRGDAQARDAAYKSELIGHPKERAEHIMLIDLERNDLGRVCVPGTVEVNELMILESYAHVHHIVSNVRGRLRDDVTPGQVIRAVFPGGTITGCPKERCMAIIAELEQAPRGAYTGSMGYINHNGDMDFNILIRTISMNKQRISLRAGAGLVADSIAEHELQETRHKAKGLLLALGAEDGH